MNDVLMEIEGQNGKAIAYQDKVVFDRSGIKGLMTQGFAGVRTFYYKDITSVDYRKPSLIANGYLKIITGGILDTNNKKVGFTKTSDNTLSDPNTLGLRAFKKETANKTEEFYNLIMKKIGESKSTNSTSTISAADEIKKFKDLLDSGIITQEEFDSKKKELLNL